MVKSTVKELIPQLMVGSSKESLRTGSDTVRVPIFLLMAINTWGRSKRGRSTAKARTFLRTEISISANSKMGKGTVKAPLPLAKENNTLLLVADYAPV